jgi:hypothetical protein
MQVAGPVLGNRAEGMVRGLINNQVRPRSNPPGAPKCPKRTFSCRTYFFLGPARASQPGLRIVIPCGRVSHLPLSRRGRH